MLTEAEYLGAGGGRCPNCGEEAVLGCDVELGETIYWNCHCIHCRAEWTEKYTLSGYINFQPPKEELDR